MTRYRRWLTPRTAFRVLLLLLLAGTASVYFYRQHDRDKPAPNAKSRPRGDEQADAILAGIDQQAKVLIGHWRSRPSLGAKALNVRSAILKRDFDTAATIATRAYKGDQFDTFAGNICASGDAKLMSALIEWAARTPQDVMPLLLHAQCGFDAAWRARGTKFSNDVEKDDLKAFQQFLVGALNDVNSVLSRAPENRYAAYLRLRILRGFGNSPEMESAFQDAVARHPNDFDLYRMRLDTLKPKWGGSVEQMKAFVRYYAEAKGHAPILSLLYVRLYADLLNNASIMCRRYRGDELSRCVGQAMNQWVTPALEQKINDVLQSHANMGRDQFASAIAPILKRMIVTRGAARSAGTFLQLTADALDTNVEMSAKDTTKNNFQVDKLTGLTWYRNGQYHNAETMYLRAIDDLDRATWPQGDARRWELARLYDLLSEVHMDTLRYTDVIAYQKAADVIEGVYRPKYSQLKCAALYRLKLYDAAIKDCTQQVESGGSIDALFWRAKALTGVGKFNQALGDFSVVASSEHRFRTSAAIEISVLYGQRGQLQKMLGALNRYRYLYDERRQSKSDLAISYNNRCYANMNLGHLKAALNDCSASLRFGNLPDAYHKQQELIKRLAAEQKSAAKEK